MGFACYRPYQLQDFRAAGVVPSRGYSDPDIACRDLPCTTQHALVSFAAHSRSVNPLNPMPVVTLPDGSQRRFEKPVTVDEVAADIGAGLRKAALAGRVNGKLVDTSHLISNDAELAIVTEKDPDGIDVIRHSTAHLLAQAVKQLFPDAQVTIGPVIQDGFYYDFSYKRPFTTEDLAAIEAKMTEIAKADLKVSRTVMERNAAVKFFRDMGELYKAEIIAGIPEKEEIG